MQAVVQQPVQQRGVDPLRLTRRFMPYPQPYPLGPALLEAQMWLLGKLLSVVNTPTLLQVSLLAACCCCCCCCCSHSTCAYCAYAIEMG
mgnify:CR=1 FL=1